MKARLLRKSQIHVGWNEKNLPIFREVDRGHVVEHADAHQLVACGAAVPADEECQRAAGMTDEQMREAQKQWERANAGIQPADYADFDAGKIVGYDADGKPIPGPHADPAPQA